MKFAERWENERAACSVLGRKDGGANGPIRKAGTRSTASTDDLTLATSALRAWPPTSNSSGGISAMLAQSGRNFASSFFTAWKVRFGAAMSDVPESNTAPQPLRQPTTVSPTSEDQLAVHLCIDTLGAPLPRQLRTPCYSEVQPCVGPARAPGSHASLILRISK